MPDKDRYDMDYWVVLGEHLGWRLVGWTYRSGATFDTSSGHIQLTGPQRDDIIAAIARQTDEPNRPPWVQRPTSIPRADGRRS